MKYKKIVSILRAIIKNRSTLAIQTERWTDINTCSVVLLLKNITFIKYRISNAFYRFLILIHINLFVILIKVGYINGR